MWPIVYYRVSRGREPVNEAILRLSPRDQVAVDNDIERLAEFGPTLPYPWSSQVNGELRELRADAGRSHYRILYRGSHNIFVLLHFLEKRVDGRPPRAAGHDAP